PRWCGDTAVAIPLDSEAKSNGIKLGEAVAAKTLEARASDGSSAPDAYRPLYPNRSHIAGIHPGPRPVESGQAPPAWQTAHLHARWVHIATPRSRAPLPVAHRRSHRCARA